MQKNKKPVIALMYDFDNTLSTTDMQNFGFLRQLRMSKEEFWQKSNNLAQKKSMDKLLAYMYLMLKESQSANVKITRENFVEQGQTVEYYPGVQSWFERINKFGEKLGVTVEHYVISSGIQEMIEGSTIYGHFRKTYACEFFYDVNGVAVWPKNVVNYTTKTQFLYRINKGVLEISEDEALNSYVPEEKRPVPFRNMIYIGDGLTDVPCMKLVKSNGGQSIAVFKNGDKESKKVAAKLLSDDRVNFITVADYSAGRELEEIVKTVVTQMASTNKLHSMSVEVNSKNSG